MNERIKGSSSLHELEAIIEQNKDMFSAGANKDDNFELEKRKFDEKIAKGRFAYVVKRQEFYEQLVASLAQNSSRMRQTVDLSTQQMKRVLHFEENNEAFINEKLN